LIAQAPTIFRTDFGTGIGLGHLKRTLIYASRFKNVIFILNKQIDLPYHSYIIHEEEEFFKLIKNLQPQQVIIDTYNFNLQKQRKFKQLFPNIWLSIFDDEYKDYHCDEIINHNLGVNKKNYKEPEKLKLIQPLVDIPLFKKRKHTIKEYIFISIGATDTQNIIPKIITILKKYSLPLHIYTTSYNPNIKKLIHLARSNSTINLFIDKDNLKGMYHAKLLIITPSTLCYEALAMKKKFIAIQTVPNQNELAHYLKRKRFHVLKKRDLYKLKGLI